MSSHLLDFSLGSRSGFGLYTDPVLTGCSYCSCSFISNNSIHGAAKHLHSRMTGGYCWLVRCIHQPSSCAACSALAVLMTVCYRRTQMCADTSVWRVLVVAELHEQQQLMEREASVWLMRRCLVFTFERCMRRQSFPLIITSARLTGPLSLLPLEGKSAAV